MKRLLRAAALLAGVLLMAGASEAQTGLLEAAARGDLAAVNRLIAAKADLEQRDGQRQTPLLLAVAGNHVAVAKALLAAGASPNAQAANQDTPWLLAGASGRTEIIAAMLPLKPDLTIRNRYGGNALYPPASAPMSTSSSLRWTTCSAVASYVSSRISLAARSAERRAYTLAKGRGVHRLCPLMFMSNSTTLE